MTVYRIQNPAAADAPILRTLVDRAFDEPGSMIPAPAAQAELRRWIADPQTVVLTGEEGGELKALLLGTLAGPVSRVVHFYNGGNGHLRRHLIEEAIKIAKAAGHTKVIIVNHSGKSDEAHMKLFGWIGPGKVLGSILEYTFNER